MANGKKKNKKKIFIFSGIGALVLIAILLVAFSGNKEEIIPVQVEEVQARNITQIVAATGKINPEYQVTITPEVTGEIVELPVKDGDHVKKGQLLVKIKPDIYIANKDRASANLDASKAGLNVKKAVLDKVTSEYERVKELNKKGLASDADLEVAKSNYLASKGDYESSQAMIQQNQASLKEANENLYKTTIYSPMDGIITQLNVQLGDRVLGSGYSMGTNMMIVADLTDINAIVEVNENDVVLVSLKDTARIEIDAFKGKKFKGVVKEIANSAVTTGAGTQQEVVNFNIKIKLVDLDDKIRPGMSCNADIETESKSNVVAVPIQSVTARGEGFTQAPPQNESSSSDENTVQTVKKRTEKPKEVVFVVENSKAKMVEVETGISDDNYVEVKKGLNKGAKVISGPYRAISKELNDKSNVMVDKNDKSNPKKS
jgi:HlyD family secretion protein